MLGRAAIVFVCLTTASVVIANAERTEPVQMRMPFDRFPMQVGEWEGVSQPPLDERVRAILGADDYLTRAYYTPDHVGAGLYVGYWRSQRQGDTIHSPLNCLPGSGWEPVSKTPLLVPVVMGEGQQSSNIGVNRYVVQKGLDRQLILYWYQSHGRVIASEYWSKIYLVTDAVRTNHTDAAIVRVIAPIAGSEPGDEARAERVATRFVQALFPVLAGYLPR